MGPPTQLSEFHWIQSITCGTPELIPLDYWMQNITCGTPLRVELTLINGISYSNELILLAIKYHMWYLKVYKNLSDREVFVAVPTRKKYKHVKKATHTKNPVQNPPQPGKITQKNLDQTDYISSDPPSIAMRSVKFVPLRLVLWRIRLLLFSE